MSTLAGRVRTEATQSVLQHWQDAHNDLAHGQQLFEAWQHAEEAVHQPQQQMHQLVMEKGQIARTSRKVLAHGRNLLRALTGRDPHKLATLGIHPGNHSRSDAAVLSRLNQLLEALRHNPQYHQPQLVDGQMLALDADLEANLNHAATSLATALSKVAQALAAYRQVKSRATSAGNLFQQWFDLATSSLRQTICTQFSQQKNELYSLFAMDIHSNRQRDRDAAWRAKRKKAMEDASPAPQQPQPIQPTPHAACPNCGVVVAFPSQAVASQPSGPQPLGPAPGIPATPEQVAEAIAASPIWHKNLFRSPTRNVAMMLNILKRLWRNPNPGFEEFKPDIPFAVSAALAQFSNLINVRGPYGYLVRLDFDARVVHFERKLLVAYYNLPELFLGETSNPV